MKIRSTDRLWNLLSNLLMNSLALKRKSKGVGLNLELLDCGSGGGQAQLMGRKGA